MPLDLSALDRSLDGLAHAASADSPQGTLQTLCYEAQHIFSADGSGLMLVDDQHVLRTVTVTDEQARVLEELQQELLEGPCVDAVVDDVLVVARDLATDRRWERFRQGIAPHPVRALLGIAVHAEGRSVGSLNVYTDRVREWDAEEIAAAAAFGRVADSVLASAVSERRQARLTAQLHEALASRAVIEQAKGILMAQRRCTADAAFDLLRRGSQRRNVKLRAVAQAVVNGQAGGPPAQGAAASPDQRSS